MRPLKRVPAWAVALALTLLAIAPAAAAAGQRYEVTWQLVQEEYVFDGRLGEGEARTVKLDVTRSNLTRVEALLTWEEGGDGLKLSRPDAFALSARGPAGLVEGSPARGRGGFLAVEASGVNPIPDPLTVEGDDAGDAHEAAARHAARGGVGEWRFTVTMEDAGNPDGTAVDKGNAYVLTVVVERYEAAVMRVVALEAPPQGAAAAGVAPPATSPLWTWAAMGLGVVALGLGGVIARERLAR